MPPNFQLAHVTSFFGVPDRDIPILAARRKDVFALPIPG
jgi:hypothetical protein